MSSAEGVLASVFLGGVVMFFIYFIPSMIAAARNKRQKLAIFMLNLCAGWTFLGWVGSLVWAVLPDGE